MTQIYAERTIIDIEQWHIRITEKHNNYTAQILSQSDQTWKKYSTYFHNNILDIVLIVVLQNNGSCCRKNGAIFEIYKLLLHLRSSEQVS